MCRVILHPISCWNNVMLSSIRHILFTGNETFYISERPGRSAFSQRNNWMVDHASRLIAVYTGAPGGTKETIKYAKAQGLEVISITDETEVKPGAN